MLHRAITIDVTDAAGLGEPAHVGATVVAPDPDDLEEHPIVVFARPGAGFLQGYYSLTLPGQSSSQAAWHAARRWIFVAVDHLGLGTSSANDPARLTYTSLVGAADGSDREIVRRLEQGTLLPELPPVGEPVVLGLGQSMGGCLTVVQQGQCRTFDGIAVLGYSARHTSAPFPPGEARFDLPWMLRDATSGEPVVLNAIELAAQAVPEGEPHPLLRWIEWGFYGGESDPSTFEDPERWTTSVYPAVVGSVTTPGVIAQEAAAVRVPVLLAVGEIDTVADLSAEVFAYQSTTDIELFVCPRMGHMHNFAPTAELLWHRIDRWGSWVRDLTLARREGLLP
jgi:alpha-beta hydrolase superfamily lysophospholipase